MVVVIGCGKIHRNITFFYRSGYKKQLNAGVFDWRSLDTWYWVISFHIALYIYLYMCSSKKFTKLKKVLFPNLIPPLNRLPVAVHVDLGNWEVVVLLQYYPVHCLYYPSIVPSSKKIKSVSRNSRLALKYYWTAECWPQWLSALPGNGPSLSWSHFHYWLWFKSGITDLTWPAAKGYPSFPLSDFFLLHSHFLCVLLGVWSSSLIFFCFALTDTWGQCSWPLVSGTLGSVKESIHPDSWPIRPKLLAEYWISLVMKLLRTVKECNFLVR